MSLLNRGGTKASGWTSSKWNEMLDEFYESHGWANETGQQTRDGLLQLGLGDVWQILEENNGS